MSFQNFFTSMVVDEFYFLRPFLNSNCSYDKKSISYSSVEIVDNLLLREKNYIVVAIWIQILEAVLQNFSWFMTYIIVMFQLSVTTSISCSN